MRGMAVRCSDLRKRFGTVRAVDGLSLALEGGRTLALLGPSGSGKTTVLRLIAGFDRPDAGTVEVGGVPVAGPGVNVPTERRRVGMVFQDYALFPHLSVADNVAFGVPREPDRGEKIARVLHLLDLTALEGRMPNELSGGQQQRVALARALAPEPEVLLLDEPFSNLDAGLRAQVREEVREILLRSGTTAIFVTHDQEEALFMGDLVGVLHGGALEQMDAPEAIFHSPSTRFVAEFVGIADFLPAEYRDGSLWTEVGSLPWPAGHAAPDGLEVMVRPDDLTLEPSDSGQGRITRRVFQGPSYRFDVAMDSGLVLRVEQHHTKTYAVGTRVRVGAHPR